MMLGHWKSLISKAPECGGAVADHPKAAVIKADWYDPAMNPKLADFCHHYGMTPMPCRSYTPQHKGKVERGVGYAKNNALKGRQFASLGEQNAHFIGRNRWPTSACTAPPGGRWLRCSRKSARRSVRCPCRFMRAIRRAAAGWRRDSFVEVAKAYYEAPPEFIGRQVWVRWDGRMVSAMLGNQSGDLLQNQSRYPPLRQRPRRRE